MSTKNEPPASLADDLLWGTEAIAEEIGRTRQQTGHLIRKRVIPVTRLGPKTFIGSRRAIRRAMAGENSEQA